MWISETINSLLIQNTFSLNAHFYSLTYFLVVYKWYIWKEIFFLSSWFLQQLVDFVQTLKPRCTISISQNTRFTPTTLRARAPEVERLGPITALLTPSAWWTNRPRGPIRAAHCEIKVKQSWGRKHPTTRRSNWNCPAALVTLVQTKMRRRRRTAPSSHEEAHVDSSRGCFLLFTSRVLSYVQSVKSSRSKALCLWSFLRLWDQIVDHDHFLFRCETRVHVES